MDTTIRIAPPHRRNSLREILAGTTGMGTPFADIHSTIAADAQNHGTDGTIMGIDHFLRDAGSGIFYKREEQPFTRLMDPVLIVELLLDMEWELMAHSPEMDNDGGAVIEFCHDDMSIECIAANCLYWRATVATCEKWHESVNTYEARESISTLDELAEKGRLGDVRVERGHHGGYELQAQVDDVRTDVISMVTGPHDSLETNVVYTWHPGKFTAPTPEGFISHTVKHNGTW